MSTVRQHLPDCMSIRRDGCACDCGRPKYPFPPSKALVRRHSERRNGPQLMVVPKTQLREDEVDLAESRLQFEADSQAWVKQQLEADERRAQRGKNVWA